MHWNRIDGLKATLACAIYIAVALAWVHWSTQTKVSRSLRNSIVIAVRLILLHGFLYVGFCVILGVWENALLIILGIFLILSPLASLDVPGDPVAIALLMPIYILKQIALGFPDRDQVILRPPTSISTLRKLPEVEPDLAEIMDQLATVIATLKPMGTIECQGKRFNAATDDGTLLDVGQLVRVCGRSKGMLQVRRSDERHESNH